MTTTFHASTLTEEELSAKPLAPPTATPLDGPIVTRGRVFYTSENPSITFGTWECEPGRSRWEFLDRGETIHVLSGRMSVQEDGGPALELAAGDSAVFPLGWRGVWQVHETLRKVYVIYRPAASD